jgi:hypothetical protein
MCSLRKKLSTSSRFRFEIANRRGGLAGLELIAAERPAAVSQPTECGSRLIHYADADKNAKQAAAGIRDCHFDQIRISSDCANAIAMLGHKTAQIQIAYTAGPRPAVT